MFASLVTCVCVSVCVIKRCATKDEKAFLSLSIYECIFAWCCSALAQEVMLKTR